MWELDGLHALVCGSTRGIGRACAERLAAQGARVTLLARDPQRLAEVCAALPGGPTRGHDWLAADFRDPPAVERAVRAYLSDHPGFDILVNNTGGPPAGPLLEAAPQALQDAFAMHVICNHLLVRALVPGMRARGFGRIINILSTSVREPIPDLGVSNTVRWAVAAWAKTLSRELAPLGITVNNVLPGFTDTARLRELLAERAARTGVPAAQIEQNLRAGVPAGRFAQPGEIAAAVVFLASREAAYVTGINLPVDGGRLASL